MKLTALAPAAALLPLLLPHAPRTHVPVPESSPASGASRSDVADQFDFMLGRWRSHARWLQPDLTVLEHEARHRFERAFGGQGIVDDNHRRLGEDWGYWGSAVRTYDPAADAWTCRWYDGELRQWAPEFTLARAGATMTGTVDGRDQHGSYTDTITFEPLGPDRVEWTLERAYAGLGEPLEVGRILYERAD